jgi:predicted Holliday junction resolvase-like endonuclease
MVALIIICGFVVCAAAGLFISQWHYRKIMHRLFKESWKNEQVRTQALGTQLEEVTLKLKKEVGRNKSVEVRTGQIMEKAVPFLDAFGHDPKNAHFCGNFIDYVVFNDDGIVFVEVKTGKARLSKKQRHIKKLIEDGKVKFELLRIDYGK